MDATTLRQHLVRLDSALGESARLCIYGSAALMLMGEEGRSSVDVDVAGPYSAVIDQADIQFLIVHGRVRYEDIAQAVHRLPAAFRDDVLVRENLENLRHDMQRWIL